MKDLSVSGARNYQPRRLVENIQTDLLDWRAKMLVRSRGTVTRGVKWALTQDKHSKNYRSGRLMENIDTDLLDCGGGDPLTATRGGNPWDMMGVDPSQKFPNYRSRGLKVVLPQIHLAGESARAPRPHRMVTCGIQRASTHHTLSKNYQSRGLMAIKPYRSTWLGSPDGPLSHTGR